MNITSIVVLIFTVASTIRTMDNTIFYTDKSRIRIYQKSHYQRLYNLRNVHQQLSIIPKDAIVSTQSAFLPHLALRDNIYQFPIINNAEYIIYSEKESTYPLNKEDLIKLTTKLESSNEWKVIYDGDVKILKKTSL